MPGRSDEQAQAFETDLYLIFEEQHLRIDLFVKSKAREIQHRLGEGSSPRILSNQLLTLHRGC